MTRLIPVLAVLLCVAACSKNGSSKPSLVGKWIQTERFDGSCNCWKTVNEFEAEKIEFNRNGTYQRTASPISSFMYCPGTYKVVNDSTLTLKMNCTGTTVENTNQFTKEGDILIIEYITLITGPGPSYPNMIKYKKE